MAPVAVGVIFSKMFADQSGLFNALLDKVGIGAIGWHADVPVSYTHLDVYKRQARSSLATMCQYTLPSPS